MRQGPLPLPAPVSVIGEEALTSASPSLASALKLSFQPPPRGGVGPVELHYLSLLAQGPATALGLLDGGHYYNNLHLLIEFLKIILSWETPLL